MIQPQELRIGNLLYHSELKQFVEVIAVGKDYIHITCNGETYYEKLIWFSGIQLTEEWLLKFGFNKDYKKGYIGIDVSNSDFVLTEPLKMGEWQTNYAFQFETGSVPKFKEIEYVNQLQNLYFALTSEELQFKQTT